ncbi:SDR family oxidoreductase [Nocardia sp. 004]|uniref:SDR family oxidoreductase n=1 Tax=Nocardia sp. 004 TaxID=3385978 RepID=UPI0039A13C41
MPDTADTAKKVVLVTGASRGIGAQTAIRLAGPGMHVVVNYREKHRRAQTVVDRIRSTGATADAVGADVSDPDSADRMLAEIENRFGRLDVLVLNASGGLERDADPGYAMRLNRDAQLHLADSAAGLMPVGGRIVFITSHQAHFHPRGGPLPAGYEPIAASKRAGEDALRTRIPDLAARGIEFVVVSGDMIDGTIIVQLLERRDPAAVDARRAHGALPTVDEFADAIARAAHAPVPLGHTVYVGGSDYLTTVQ